MSGRRTAAGGVKGVIYDLDGTLVDSAGDIAWAVNAALAKRGLAELPVAKVASMVGTGGRNVCRLALQQHVPDVSDEEVAATYADFFAAYRERPVVDTKPYPGAAECLAKLRDLGLRQGICTNKSTVVSGLVLKKLGLRGYFSSVIAGDATPMHKPAKEHLLGVIGELGLGPREVAYVGDTKVDLDTAKGAEVDKFFVVAWGNPDAHEEGFSTTLPNFADLPRLLGLTDT